MLPLSRSARSTSDRAQPTPLSGAQRAISHSVRVRSRTPTELSELMQSDKSQLESFKSSLLGALERDRRLFNLELPERAERRPSVRPPFARSASLSATAPVVAATAVVVDDVVALPAPSPSVVDVAASPMLESVVLPDDEVDALRDMWGNAVPEQHEDAFTQWYEKFVGDAHVSQRAAQLLLDSLEEDVDHHTTRWFLCTRDPSHDCRVLVRNGIAPNWRGRVYSLLLDLEARSHVAGHDHFAQLSSTVARELKSVATIDPQLRAMYEQIDRDVPRTLPDVMPFHVGFLDKLALVLRVYSRSNNFRYTQGLNFIAGSLLLIMEPREAFLVLRIFAEELLPFYFSDGMIGLLSDTRLMELIVEEQLPKLWGHFQRINLSMLLITSSWFTTCFCKNMPIESSFRVWDLILLDGGIARMFEFALRILALFERELLAINDDVDLVCALNVHVESLYDFDRLLKVKLAHPLVSSNVQLARVRLRREVLASTKRSDASRTKH